MNRHFDRTIENTGNVILLEHLNLTVPDPALAHLFYVSGLGLTRDPYVDFGTLGIDNFWVNAGQTQFHLPKGPPQVFRGTIHLMIGDLADLRRRLDQVGRKLKDTQFGFEVGDDHLSVTCPWGNQIRCAAPAPESRIGLGIAGLDMKVPPGTAAGIASFYHRVLGAPARTEATRAVVSMGTEQRLTFIETDAEIARYDGHHIAIYVADFSSPHAWLVARNHISEESDQHQYRFQAIVDPQSGVTLTELEHEVRSLKHPMYGRNLVNRNATLQFFAFHRGREVFVP